ncbi:hypothetical protein ACKI16_47620, partial [Streptomyces scabiei]|uniref:hypothetical protein n=1 Tax=Streptomyces scabiei TaxID=1930 RepID=UPI0038F6D23A
LQADLAAVVDDARAYRALFDTLAEVAPERVDAVRTDTAWIAGRPLASALLFTPCPVLDAVDRAVRAATAPSV